MPMSRAKAKQQFTIPQVQVLRELYGYAVTLIRNASGHITLDNPDSWVMVEGGDFVKLANAIERVKKCYEEGIAHGK